MASAFIIFDNSQAQLSLSNLHTQLHQKLSLQCVMSEWRFASTVIPQIRLDTIPPIALQLDEDPSIVPEEIQELLDDCGDDLGEVALFAARICRSRLDVVSCEETQIDHFSEDGICVRTPNADIESPSVQEALCQVAEIVHGWVFDNINGRWLNSK